MPDEKDTGITPETDPSQVIGTAEGEPSTGAEPVKETAQETVDREAYEQLQKELNKAQQELNLRRNNEKKAELEKLESEGKWKELAEKRQQELDEIRQSQEQSKQRQEAEDFRKSVLSEYDKDVQDIAEALKLWWDGPESDDTQFGFEDAKVQLKSKLDAIQAKVGTKKVAEPEDDEEVSISANNPVTDLGQSELDKLRSMSSDELRKILPKAESR